MHDRCLVANVWLIIATAIFIGWPNLAMAEDFKANYDEASVPAYTLPDPLIDEAGRPVTSAEAWTTKRRPEILRLFKTQVYGRAPQQKPTLEFKVESVDDAALGGKAIRKEVTITVVTAKGRVPLHLLLYVPKQEKPAPVFLGLNFQGNQAVHTDPGITLASAWLLNHPEQGINEHRATEDSRGGEASRWQVEKVIARGYAVATICCGDIEPDTEDGLSKGVRALFLRDGQTAPDADEWGTVAAWAWGLSGALDYLETDPLVDAKHVTVFGHSRFGKAAIWAGACDPRFAIVISNESGCCGAALSKRIFGETVGRINTKFPHWFCGNLHKYNEKESELPVDQHELLALIAPRPLYLASAEGDRWADPRGEFLSAQHAEPVYHLFGLKGLGVTDMPPVNHPVGDTIGYHIRTGKHDVTAYDWEQYMAFADRHFKAQNAPKPTRN